MTSSTHSQNAHAGGADAANEMFTRMWSDFANRMMSNGMATGGAPPSADAARQMRDTFLNSWSDACDRYMRSDEFRVMMRESMKAAIELRKQLNEQMGEFQHAVQGASRQDIDRLLQGIDNLERRVNQTYEELLGQFQSLSQRMEALETGKKQANKSARKPVKKKSASKKTPKKKTAKKTKRTKSRTAGKATKSRR